VRRTKFYQELRSLIISSLAGVGGGADGGFCDIRRPVYRMVSYAQTYSHGARLIPILVMRRA
jgi:hypothetical protein